MPQSHDGSLRPTLRETISFCHLPTIFFFLNLSLSPQGHLAQERVLYIPMALVRLAYVTLQRAHMNTVVVCTDLGCGAHSCRLLCKARANAVLCAVEMCGPYAGLKWRRLPLKRPVSPPCTHKKSNYVASFGELCIKG